MGTYCDQVVSSDALETKMKPNCEQIDAQRSAMIKFYGQAPFASLKKQGTTLFWLIYCERKTLFRMKKQAEKDGL